MNLRNPLFNPFQGLLTPAQRDTITNDIRAFFVANRDRASIPEEEVRAAASFALSDAQWGRIRDFLVSQIN